MKSDTTKLTMAQSVPGFTLANAAFGLYVLTLILLPACFGGNRDMPFGFAQMGLAISAVLLVFEQSILKECFWPKRIIVAFGFFVLIIAWGLLQTQSFMPADWHHPLWQEAAKELNKPIHGSIGLWHDEAFFALSRMITYICAGILGYIFAQDVSRARLMMRALWYSGIALCTYGYFNIITGTEKVWWLDKPQYQGDLTSTFISKNHFAIYAALVLLCGCALLYQSWRNDLRAMPNKKFIKSLALWLKEKALFQLFLIAYVVGAILLTHCRSGLILSIAGLATFFISYQLYAKQWRYAALLAVASAILAVIIMLIAIQSSDHFATLFIDQSSHDRLGVYKISLEAIADNPWLGYGIGSYHAVFRMYNHAIALSFNHAHSDPLESLVDLGIPVGLMLWGAIALLLSGVARGIFKRRRHGMFPAMGLAASVIVLFHSAIDFSLQIPGVAMPFAMLLGIGLAQSWGESEKA
jgi:O-antigen ligase